MELKNRNVVVVGTGVSGTGMVSLLSKVGANITVYDANTALTAKDIKDRMPQDAEYNIVIGDISDDIIERTELLAISPGVPIDSDIVNRFRDKGVAVWGEIELAYNYDKGTVIAITGTNGKTTTTTLVGEIMKKHNPKTFVVGNIGNSYPKEVLNTDTDSVTVAEISSFQLESVHSFAPHISAILNITPDHLNRHYTMENYIAVKESVVRNSKPDDVCVLNYDDEVLREFGEKRENVLFFSRKSRVEKGAYLEGDMIRFTDGDEDYPVISIHDMKLFGNHNYENVMAAVAITTAFGVPLDVIADTIREFRGVEHRIEYVRDLKGVTYYNDSKGTNPDSSIKALEAMSRPTLLIAGGYDKHSEFDEFLDAFDGKVKLLVLIGATAGKIEQTARKHGFNAIVRTDTLENAVSICAENAVENDVVLLSPACASWDMFSGYEERGRLFKEYVNRLV